MKVCIVGWYGTETLGDRAILAGIFDFLASEFDDFEVKLGSLFPFFSKRTFSEDAEFYDSFLSKELKGEIFESKRRKDLDSAIEWADLVMIGGGPLMHINDLFMLEYALKRASKKGKATRVFGCGVGPLFKKRHTPALWGIMKYADEIILRDDRSLDYMKNLSEKRTARCSDKIRVALDPSIKALDRFKKARHFREGADPYVAINLRSFPAEYAKTDIGSKVNDKLAKWLKSLHENLGGTEIHLIPMHYFHIGNDDRAFMNHLRFSKDIEGIKIQNEPLSLFETMLEFQEAQACVGMRFHSVIFQTMLNGNNYILDYTEPDIGKISGFLSVVDHESFYNDRYVNLQQDKPIPFDDLSHDKKLFKPDDSAIQKSLSIFEESLRNIG